MTCHAGRRGADGGEITASGALATAAAVTAQC
jgi:hypothetical protein